MKPVLARPLFRVAALLVVLPSAWGQVGRAMNPTGAIDLRVDLTDASRHLLHITETIPVHTGMNSFSYAEWIPGEELPGGAIDNVVGLYFRASSSTGPVLAWRRDLVDAYQFHVNVPRGVSSVAVAFDVLTTASSKDRMGLGGTSMHVAMLEPSQVILYPSNTPVRNIAVTPSLHLPSGWKAATALRTEAPDAGGLNGQDTTFKTVSVEQLVDSPILAGDHCRQYSLASEVHPAHTMDVCAEKADALELQPALLAHMNDLVRQADKLFAGHHYEHYDFLVGVSSQMHGTSLEHTQSADYIVQSLDVSDWQTQRFLGYLLPHEYTHAWCGKYRRPAGIATPDYHVPMQNDLIWVYEGFTQYYGNVLSARAGFFTPERAINLLDQEAYQVDVPGQQWRSVQDTADASSILRGGDASWANWRLGQHYYQDGTLLWLEADMKIRELSHGKKSLDDFAAHFFSKNVSGAPAKNTPPGVVPFLFTDVVKSLSDVAPYDWAAFWTTRLNALRQKAPVEGLKAAGWDYVYSEKMSPDEASSVNKYHIADMNQSLGFLALPDGKLQDIYFGSVAYLAGLAPEDKLLTVNGKPYSSDVLTAAVRDAKTGTAPILLTAAREGETLTFSLPYHGGEKYSVLQRNANPDLLATSILKPK